MFKTYLKRAFLLICAVVWFLILSAITWPASIVGDIKLWAGVLSIFLGLSVWARFSLKSKAAQEAYDEVTFLLLLALWPYIFSRLFLSTFLSTILLFPVLIWIVLCQNITPILLHHHKIAAAYRYISMMQARFPRSIELAMQRVMLAEYDRNYEAIITETSRIIALHDQSSDLLRAYQARLAAYLEIGEGEKALTDARVVIRVGSKSDLTHIHRGIAFMLVGDFDAAAADLEHALSITTQPSCKVRAQVHLGLIEYVMENDDAAQEFWTRALEAKLSPDETKLYTTDVYVCMGLLAFHRGESFKAWQAYRTALSLNPESVAARAGMAIIHAADDHWDKALKIWRCLLAEHPYFAVPEDVIRRHFRWTPPMAEGVREIVARLDSKGPLIDALPDHTEQAVASLPASR